MPPKSQKKGKGGPQKAAGPKGKAFKPVPMDVSDSDEESSEEETVPVVKVKGKANAKVNKKAPAPVQQQESSDEDSDDESDEEETPVNVSQIKKVTQADDSDEDEDESDEEQTPVVAAKTEDGDEDEDDSSEEEEEPVVEQKKRKKPQQTQEKKPQKKVKANAKVTQADEDDSEDDSDEEDDSSEKEEEPVVEQKKRKKPQQTQEKKTQKKVKANAKPAQVDEDDSEEDSDEEDEEEDEPVVEQKKKPQQKVKANGKATKSEEDDSEEDSDEEDSDEEESEEEEEQQKVAKKKSKKESKESKPVATDEVISIFCGNLKDDCEPKDLTKFFKKNGIPVSDARKTIGKRFGYVDLADAGDLETALALNQTDFKGQPMKVDQAKKRPDPGTPKTPKDKSHKTEENSRTMFVKNLAESVTESSLQKMFSDALSVRLPMSGSGHKGFAFIEFSDSDMVEKSMENHQGADLEGQALFLDYVGQKSKFQSPAGSRNQSSGDPGKSKALFVKNLSYSVTEETLLEKFEGAVAARVPHFPDTGKPKGFAFVDFGSAEQAQEAYNKLQGQDLEGRRMTIDYATERGDRGGRSPGGRGGFGGGRGGGFRGGRGRGGGRGGRDGGRGGRGGFRGGRGGRGDFGGKRTFHDNHGAPENKKIKLDSDSD